MEVDGDVHFSKKTWWAFVGMSVGPALTIGIPILMWGSGVNNRITRMETILEYQNGAYLQSLDNNKALLRIEASNASIIERIKRLEARKPAA